MYTYIPVYLHLYKKSSAYRFLCDVFPVVHRTNADDNELPTGAVQSHVPVGRLRVSDDVLQRLY